uniref:Enoyl reductase (ER) domain-containing protein n=1 Tax=Zooxanthella nutricula TaxID=1333877 RepID=A0A7S2J7X5_9DINO
MPVPELRPRDLLVKVAACGLNPVDTKVRSKKTDATLTEPKVMGYDGAGVVERVGADCSLFKVGDKVYFAGAIDRQGSNAEFVAIDERIVGHMPKTLSVTAAAAQPLVLLTAWEGLVEGLGLTAFNPANQGKRLLILPGGGGVGSYVIQLAARVFGLEVIATASRPESADACKGLGATHVINHREPLQPQLKKLGIESVNFIYNAFDTKVYFDQYADIAAPLGKIVSIVETDAPLPMTKLMSKKVSFAWEFMFTRPMFGVDQGFQGFILNEGAKLIDTGMLKLPQVKALPFDVKSIREAHLEQESGKVIGKIVLTREAGEVGTFAPGSRV